MKVIINLKASKTKYYGGSMKFLIQSTLSLVVALVITHHHQAQAQGAIPGQSNDEIETMTQAKIFR